VVQTGLAIGGRGTFVEYPGFSTLSLAKCPSEHVVGLPSSQFGLFNSYKIKFSADGAKHGTPSVDSN
jgi:hypothetical protein